MLLDLNNSLPILRLKILELVHLLLQLVFFCHEFFLLFVFGYEILVEMLNRLPSIVTGGVTLPLDAIVQLAVDFFFVEDIFDLVT
jgi:hypothetical protein